jgi:hypothetical protein
MTKNGPFRVVQYLVQAMPSQDHENSQNETPSSSPQSQSPPCDDYLSSFQDGLPGHSGNDNSQPVLARETGHNANESEGKEDERSKISETAWQTAESRPRSWGYASCFGGISFTRYITDRNRLVQRHQTLWTKMPQSFDDLVDVLKG